MNHPPRSEYRLDPSGISASAGEDPKHGLDSPEDRAPRKERVVVVRNLDEPGVKTPEELALEESQGKRDEEELNRYHKTWRQYDYVDGATVNNLPTRHNNDRGYASTEVAGGRDPQLRFAEFPKEEGEYHSK